MSSATSITRFGRLVGSTGARTSPTQTHRTSLRRRYTALNPDGYYFDTVEFSYTAEHAGRTVTYTNWHRPLHAMVEAFTAAGFRISVISEPPVAPDTPKELLPPDLGDRSRFISFVFFVLEAS